VGESDAVVGDLLCAVPRSVILAMFGAAGCDWFDGRGTTHTTPTGSRIVFVDLAERMCVALVRSSRWIISAGSVATDTCLCSSNLTRVIFLRLASV
jgi:hypothetical protein